jgi:hypothetical protein
MHFLNTDTTDYDLVFIGSSRVAGHIDPKIMDSVCGLNSMCVAMDGSTITQQLAMLKEYMARHKSPKLVVLGLDLQTLDASHLPFNYPDYYAYLGDSIFAGLNMEAIPRFKNRIWYEKHDAFIKYSAKSDYQKFAALCAVLKLHKKFSDLEDDVFHTGLVYYKGFVAIDEHWASGATNSIKGTEKLKYSPQGLEMLREFIVTAQRYSPHVIIAFTPMYSGAMGHYEGYNEYSQQITNVANKCKVTYWDFRTDSICSDTANFYEAIHLNKAGARKFSLEMAGDIKKYLEQ